MKNVKKAGDGCLNNMIALACESFVDVTVTFNVRFSYNFATYVLLFFRMVISSTIFLSDLNNYI